MPNQKRKAGRDLYRTRGDLQHLECGRRLGSASRGDFATGVEVATGGTRSPGWREPGALTRAIAPKPSLYSHPRRRWNSRCALFYCPCAVLAQLPRVRHSGHGAGHAVARQQYALPTGPGQPPAAGKDTVPQSQCARAARARLSTFARHNRGTCLPRAGAQASWVPICRDKANPRPSELENRVSFPRLAFVTPRGARS